MKYSRHWLRTGAITTILLFWVVVVAIDLTKDLGQFRGMILLLNCLGLSVFGVAHVVMASSRKSPPTILVIKSSQQLVLAIASYTATYYRSGLKDLNDTVHDKLTSLYFAIITLTTVGFGDVQPTTGVARCAAAMEAIYGFAMLGLFVTFLSNFKTQGMARLNPGDFETTEKTSP